LVSGSLATYEPKPCDSSNLSHDQLTYLQL